MPTATPEKPTTRLNPSEVETAVIELLARDLGREPLALRQELSQRGAALPVDSLAIVEILCDVEERFDVRLPEDQLTAASLRSVRGLAKRICSVAVVAGEGV